MENQDQNLGDNRPKTTTREAGSSRLSAGLEVANGDYRLVRPLGSGGFGEVWLAHNRSLQRDVALKFFVGGGSRDELDRLVSEEGPKLAALSGKQSEGWENILIVHRCVVSEGDTPPFLELEFMEGGSMRDILRKEGAISDEDLLLRLALQLGRGLMCAHRHGLIHCDLKPDNILCDSEQRIFKLSDFGLAVKLQQGGRRGGGTPPYMSPEQFGETDRINTATDIYALGCLLYECLEGRPPFVVDKRVPVEKRWAQYKAFHRDEEPERITSTSCSDPLKDLIMRCLAKSPSQRPPAAEFVQILHSIGKDSLRVFHLKPRMEKLVLLEDPVSHTEFIQNKDLELSFSRLGGPGSTFFPDRVITQMDFLKFVRDPSYTKWNPQAVRLDSHDGGFLPDWFQGHPRRGAENAILCSVPYQAAEDFCRWLGGELPEYRTLEQFFEQSGDPRQGRCHPIVNTLWDYMQFLKVPYLQLWCRDDRTKGSKDRAMYRFGLYPKGEPAIDELQRWLRKVQRPMNYCFRSYLFIPVVPDEYTTGIARKGGGSRLFDTTPAGEVSFEARSTQAPGSMMDPGPTGKGTE